MSISHSDQFDPNLVNNTASVSETPQQADLVVTNTLNATTPNVGDTVTYTITVHNSGPNTATNVSLQDVLPVGLSYLSDSGGGTYTSSSGAWIWTVGTVTNGSTQTLTIVAKVVEPGAATDGHGVRQPQRRVRSEPGEQHGERVGNPPTGGLVGHRHHQRHHTQRGGHRHLHGHSVQLRSEHREQRLAPRCAAGGTLVPLQHRRRRLHEWLRHLDPVGSVTSGSTQTLTIVAKVVSPAATTDTASVSHSDQYDPNHW